MSVLNPTLREAMEGLRGTAGQSLTNNWYYVYAADFTAIAAGSSQSQQIRINGGEDFLAYAVMARAYWNSANTPTGETAEAPLYRLKDSDGISAAVDHLGNTRIQWQVSSRRFMNQPIRTDLVTGEPGTPFPLPVAFYVAGHDTLTVEFFNDSPGVTGHPTPAIDATVAFIGMNMLRNG